MRPQEALHERIAELREEVDFLRAENAYLKNLFDDEARFPPKWNLTRRESQLLQAMARGAMRKEAIVDAIWREEQGPKIIDVFICKLRRKLAPHGIAIVTVWGVGYRIADDALDLVREYLPSRSQGGVVCPA